MKPSAVVFSHQGDKYIGTSYETMDCQKFYEQMLRDVGIIKDLRGSNAWFRAMDWVGTPEECKKKFGSIPTGATLFILENDGGEVARGYKDGLGNASHIGVYIARRDGAIHSSQSRGCVAYSVFNGKSIKGGWNRVGLTSLLTYGEKVDAMIGTPTDIPFQTADPIAGKAVVTGGKLYVRGSPGGVKIDRLDDGAEVTVVSTDGDWTEISKPRHGYVMTQYLKPCPEAATVDLPVGSVQSDFVLIQLPLSVAQVLKDALVNVLGVG